MPTASRWQNVPGWISRELVRSESGGVVDLTSDSEQSVDALADLAPLLDSPDGAELVLRFTSTGYYQPPSMYGGPDRLGWPEEGAEDREPDGATLDGQPLPDDLAAKLFRLYWFEIERAELEIE